MASSTSSTKEYVTKPNPLERLVPGSLITCKQQDNAHLLREALKRVCAVSHEAVIEVNLTLIKKERKRIYI